jgi:hypothetical protein
MKMPIDSEATTSKHRKQSALTRKTEVNVPLAVVASLCCAAIAVLFNKADAAEAIAIQANSCAESTRQEMRREVMHISDGQKEVLERVKNIELMMMQKGI